MNEQMGWDGTLKKKGEKGYIETELASMHASSSSSIIIKERTNPNNRNQINKKRNKANYLGPTALAAVGRESGSASAARDEASATAASDKGGTSVHGRKW